ncbi:OPT-domain-containing protein [Suhomyces tanzawaensis NRRL Y-17324]|uniref:OPT-domain-containing protein n=1 Tax=Suhomyces tanzawaensis NRRL Y-17324 TaxID=984487 RepID=A0A1E4SK22_9ASCO|nr:OPT-domain-containing protein [Suhomyces tanzawaensis NRRL Y-17324]ODV79853.1 OPT-domain-containing protein [Suhomyces tanzawaensis NRRL Y-17324]
MSVEKDILDDTKVQNVTSVASHLDIADHEVNLAAVVSHKIAIEDVGVELTSDQKYLVINRLNLTGLTSLDDLPLTVSFILDKIQKLTVEESLKILRKAVIEYANDVNIPVEEYSLYEKLVESSDNYSSEEEHLDTREKLKIVDWNFQVRLEATLIAYHSPYQEVRSVTDPFDDPTIKVETLRVYVLGLIWTCISAFVNQFFDDRLPGITLSTSVAQMLLYPCGKAWEFAIPNWKLKLGKYEIELNPGPWTYKEQILSGLMFTVGGGSSYAAWNITAQKLDTFYGNDWVTTGYQVLLLLSINFMGIGFAGVLRKFVVYPTRSIWPGLLPTLALNRALLVPEKKENINGWTISRYRFFFFVTSASFLYFWIPDYLFQALSYFGGWMTWIKPNNFNLAVITGPSSGLGFSPIPSFDWNVVGTNALTTPFYSTINQIIGTFLSFFIIVGVYYSNHKWTGYLPINSNRLFSNTGSSYKISKILNEDNLFDQEKYEKYGPPFYTAANIVLYSAFFALYPFAIIHEIAMTYEALWDSLKGFYHSLRNFRRSTFEGFDDPHSLMMRKYKEVPDWVFLVVLVISIVLAILCAELYPTNTPVWAIFFALGINFVFLIPITTLYSTTNFSFGLNVLVELIIGYALPGNGFALLFIKALGYNIDGQAQNYITDQKIGHYAKIPPRAMFRIQIIGVFVGTFINLAALNFKINHIEDYCAPLQKDKFSCPNSGTIFAASVIWGVIGPKKVFHGLYPIMQYAFLIGALVAIPFVIIKLYGPKKYVKYFQPSLILGGFIIWAPGSIFYQLGQVYLSTAFMWYGKSRYPAFWNKYNYVFSSAMSAGVAFSSIIIFFAVQYHAKDIEWWGNTVVSAGIDGDGNQRLLNASLLPDGYFGPRIGHFP